MHLLAGLPNLERHISCKSADSRRTGQIWHMRDGSLPRACWQCCISAFTALHRQRATVTCQLLKYLVIVFPPYNYVRWAHKQQPALVLFPRFIFSPMSETKESFTFPWASALYHPPPLFSLMLSLSLSLTNKSLFNPRLDYNSEVIAWPSSSSPLSEGPPPNLEEQLFINVLLTSLLQCNAGKGPPLGIVLMGRARVRLVKQITAKGQWIGLRGDQWGLPLIILYNGSQGVILPISLIAYLEC